MDAQQITCTAPELVAAVDSALGGAVCGGAVGDVVGRAEGKSCASRPSTGVRVPLQQMTARHWDTACSTGASKGGQV